MIYNKRTKSLYMSYLKYLNFTIPKRLV
ncbi:hypothetical protein F383_38007 [Gossypium arboreum]|uniref:Uncharacterized protein n=1 Tax=Gossypium arboreum TaxID=29729 RepID=A0A0B0MJ13_GOSAR|nr:hypothetical protein F383_38007 [Gossypium arboreum]